jgi:hypothetical protein
MDVHDSKIQRVWRTREGPFGLESDGGKGSIIIVSVIQSKRRFEDWRSWTTKRRELSPPPFYRSSLFY